MSDRQQAHAEMIFREALQRIADGIDDCQCDHDDENCCAKSPSFTCAFCIAIAALDAGAAALSAPPVQPEQKNESGAGLIHQTIPDMEGTEPRLIEQRADKLVAVAEWFRDCKTLTLENMPHGLIAALEAGAAALRASAAGSHAHKVTDDGSATTAADTGVSIDRSDFPDTRTMMERATGLTDFTEREMLIGDKLISWADTEVLDTIAKASQLSAEADAIIEGKDRLITAFREYAELEAAIEDFDCPHDADAHCDCGRKQHAMFLRATKMREGLLLGSGNQSPDAERAAATRRSEAP